MKRNRLLNKNGRLTSIRVGMKNNLFVDIYIRLLNLTWPRFTLALFFVFLSLNLFFATLYNRIPDHISPKLNGFSDAFFFSVHTLSTIGYGNLAPNSILSNSLVTIQAFSGLIFTAMTTGLCFAKFAKPKARIEFSRNAVITSFEGKPAFSFRMANLRSHEMIDAKLSGMLIIDESNKDSGLYRRFHTFSFVRNRTPLFALSWTAFHIFDDSSVIKRALESNEHFEIIVSLSGLDTVSSELIHTRHSYTREEILFGHELENMIELHESGRTKVDYSKIHNVVKSNATPS